MSVKACKISHTITTIVKSIIVAVLLQVIAFHETNANNVEKNGPIFYAAKFELGAFSSVGVGVHPSDIRAAKQMARLQTGDYCTNGKLSTLSGRGLDEGKPCQELVCRGTLWFSVVATNPDQMTSPANPEPGQIHVTCGHKTREEAERQGLEHCERDKPAGARKCRVMLSALNEGTVAAHDGNNWTPGRQEVREYNKELDDNNASGMCIGSIGSHRRSQLPIFDRNGGCITFSFPFSWRVPAEWPKPL